jgi:hypothetical protein
MQKLDEIHAALVANGLNNEVANFLVALVSRIEALENVPPAEPQPAHLPKS